MNHCVDCKHFKRVKKNQKGGWYGDCPIRNNPKDYYGRRRGRNPACKKFETEENK